MLSESSSVKVLNGEQVLFMGLDQVRELTQRTQSAIVHNRPYSLIGRFPEHGLTRARWRLKTW